MWPPHPSIKRFGCTIEALLFTEIFWIGRIKGRWVIQYTLWNSLWEQCKSYFLRNSVYFKMIPLLCKGSWVSYKCNASFDPITFKDQFSVCCNYSIVSLSWAVRRKVVGKQSFLNKEWELECGSTWSLIVTKAFIQFNINWFKFWSFNPTFVILLPNKLRSFDIMSFFFIP